MTLVVILGGAFLYSDMLSRMSEMEKQVEGDVARVGKSLSKKQDAPKGTSNDLSSGPESMTASVTIGNPLVNGYTSVEIE
jgi:hypothetical protein